MKSPFNKVSGPRVKRSDLDKEGKAIWDAHRKNNPKSLYGGILRLLDKFKKKKK